VFSGQPYFRYKWLPRKNNNREHNRQFKAFPRMACKNRYKYLYAGRKQLEIPVFQNDHLCACSRYGNTTILHHQFFENGQHAQSKQ
jgi:hypothetical protein